MPLGSLLTNLSTLLGSIYLSVVPAQVSERVSFDPACGAVLERVVMIRTYSRWVPLPGVEPGVGVSPSKLHGVCRKQGGALSEDVLLSEERGPIAEQI